MENTTATLLSALIGAVIGSIGAVFIQFWLSSRSETKKSRLFIAQKYLFQLQDAAEALWYRLDTLAVWSSTLEDDGYFEVTTLYAVGRVLACERLLVMDGVYPVLRDLYPGLTEVIRTQIDKTIGKLGWKQYDRIALAESLIMLDESGNRLNTLLEFRNEYQIENQQTHAWLEPAKNAIHSLNVENVRLDISALMSKIAIDISKQIGVASAL